MNIMPTIEGNGDKRKRTVSFKAKEMEVDVTAYKDLGLAEATAVQNRLREKLDLSPLQRPVRVIAGADISLDLYSEVVYAGIVLLNYNDLQPFAYSLVKGRTSFPYVPGFLAFREIPAILEAFHQLPVKPDLIMFDGNGILHARRMGIASHFGVLTQTVTMGCAKKKLAGKFAEPGANKGDYSPVIDKNETIGYALRSKNNVKPIFISPGNAMSLTDSLAITMRCLGKYRLPEPTRQAHEFVNRFRTGALSEGYHEMVQMRLF
ncbi:Endonuclease V [Dyadobacter sp. CECT 9275]|uniref:Endonuclease V n=1 Tax=Dyadobacter helix TaxID=2822344 RepID=A0A916JH76_9BACT|nr:deoxyribonuclease V [Dyadobacter sp. CECT 9275]CAG5018210.1 Endonuclease V [Dyadobacter sp. CECT 9275]